MTDDDSVDSTFNILTDIAQADSRVKPHKNTHNNGAAITRNNSLARAEGNYIAFVDADDTWLPGKLQTQHDIMKKGKHKFTFTAYSIMDEAGNSLNRTVDTQQLHPISYSDMLRKKATIGCSTVMLDRTAFVDISMPPIRTGQDYALWLKLLKTGACAFPINTPLTKYRIHPNSISRNKLNKARRQWQIYRECEQLSIFTSIECFCFYAVRAVFR